MKRLACLLALAGCNQVFGLEETVPFEDRGVVTGVYKLRWAENDMMGAPVIRDGVYAAEELTADLVLDDGSRRDVTFGADGAFSFTTAEVGQAYSLMFRSELTRTTYQYATTDLLLVDRFAGRRNRMLVPRGTELVYQVANRPVSPSTTIREEIMTTGIWTRRQVTGLSPIRYDWKTADRQTNPLGLLDAAAYDDAYYAYIDSASSAYFRILTSARARGTLAGGQVTTFNATAASLSPNLCAQLDMRGKQERQRVGALFADDSGGTYTGWAVGASPSAELAPTALLPLAFAGGFVATDTSLMIGYGNPFPGGAKMLYAYVVAYRKDGDFAVSEAYVPVSACPAATTFEAGIVAIPTAVSIDGTELTATDQFIMIDRSKPVTVTWTQSAGRADVARISLVEVVDDTTSIVRTTVVTAGMQARFETADLDRGRQYSLQIRIVAGAPGAAIGHFDVAEDTTYVGWLQSKTFTIAN